MAVHGSKARFPVRRIICVGRNYAAHARDMGRAPDREPPFFFKKPTDATASVGDFQLSGVSLRNHLQGQSAIEMRMPSSAYQDPAKERLTDRTFMARLPIDFHDGTIDVDMASLPQSHTRLGWR